MAKTSKTKTSKAKTSKAKTSKAKTATRASKAKAPAGKSNGNRPPAEVKLAELKRRLLEISDLNAASSAARVGPCHLHADGRRCRARPPGRDAAHGWRTRDRSIRRSAS